MDLSTLRRRVVRLARALGEAERAGIGLDLCTIYDPFGDLASADARDLAQEGLRAAADEPARRAARRRLELVRQATEGRCTAALLDERRRFENQATLQQPGGAIPFRESARRLLDEPSRDARAALARARDHAISTLDAPLARRVAECQELAGGWDYDSYLHLLEACWGVDLGALAVEAQAVLAATEDAFRDVMSYGLRRMHLKLELLLRGEASAHDLARAARLAPLDDVFPARKLRRVALGVFEAVGLSPTAGGRIALDVSGSAAGTGRERVLALEVPDEIVVALDAVGGAPDFAALLRGLGEAHFLAAADGEAPAEDRYCPDAALRAAAGALFGRLTTDAGFVRRTLERDAAEATEATRLVAIDALRELRQACAQLLFERTLYTEGPRGELMGLCREGMRKALLVDWPVERWLWDVEPGLRVAHRLRGAALEAALHEWVRDQANEDYWRNPRTGGLLTGLWTAARTLRAEEVATELLGRGAGLQRAADRLIAIAAR